MFHAAVQKAKSLRLEKERRLEKLEQDNTAYIRAKAERDEARRHTDFIAKNATQVSELSRTMSSQRGQCVFARSLGLGLGLGCATSEFADLGLLCTTGDTSRTLSLAALKGMEPPGGQVFIYSGQKLNWSEWQKEQMRQRLGKDKKSTYTYSQEFNSLTMSLVNEVKHGFLDSFSLGTDAFPFGVALATQAEMEQLEQKASRRKWTTKRGFVYPAPRVRGFLSFFLSYEP